MIERSALEREAELVRERYARRVGDYISDSKYHPSRPDRLFARHEKERILAKLLRAKWTGRLEQVRVLEIGSESGKTLEMLLGLGLVPENVVGIDLIEEHVARARRALPPGVTLLQGDVTQLDMAPRSFDLVVQSTVFSSILDDGVRREIAKRMDLWAKEDGAIYWYDLRFRNPANRDVQPIDRAELRSLFPSRRIRARPITLAPPIARRLARFGYGACRLAGALPFLRGHLFAWIE